MGMCSHGLSDSFVWGGFWCETAKTNELFGNFFFDRTALMSQAQMSVRPQTWTNSLNVQCVGLTDIWQRLNPPRLFFSVWKMWTSLFVLVLYKRLIVGLKALIFFLMLKMSLCVCQSQCCSSCGRNNVSLSPGWHHSVSSSIQGWTAGNRQPWSFQSFKHGALTCLIPIYITLIGSILPQRVNGIQTESLMMLQFSIA